MLDDKQLNSKIVKAKCLNSNLWVRSVLFRLPVILDDTAIQPYMNEFKEIYVSRDYIWRAPISEIHNMLEHFAWHHINDAHKGKTGKLKLLSKFIRKWRRKIKRAGMDISDFYNDI